MTFHTFLLPTDGSEAAETAANSLLAVAAPLDATVHVVPMTGAVVRPVSVPMPAMQPDFEASASSSTPEADDE